jgi:hypothetical protein
LESFSRPDDPCARGALVWDEVALAVFTLELRHDKFKLAFWREIQSQQTKFKKITNTFSVFHEKFSNIAHFH